MPKLDVLSSNEFWKNYQDPSIYRVIAFMETVEEWTMDGNPALERALTKIGELFDEISKFELGKEEQFISLCTHLKTSRILRILQTIDTIEPGSASKLLMYAEENNHPGNTMANLFLRRNIAFERLRLLSRVFQDDRLKLVQEILEEDMG